MTSITNEIKTDTLSESQKNIEVVTEVLVKNTNTTSVEDGKPKTMTKSQMKKIQRRERMKEKYRFKKEKKKEAKRLKREKLGLPLITPPTPGNEEVKARRKQMKLEEHNEWVEKIKFGQRVIIDCDFHDIQNEREVRSLGQQLAHCYSLVRTNKQNPFNLHFSSITGQLKNQLNKLEGFSGWNITTSEDTFENTHSAKNELVYLTADSENQIDTLDKSKIYIIGGLVDRNRFKNITLDRANEKGITTARLPIGDYMKLHSSVVLTVNHVFDILVKYDQLKDWNKALEAVIPNRKITGESSKTRFNANKKRKRENTKSNYIGDDVYDEEVAKGEGSEEAVKLPKLEVEEEGISGK